ncbi:MAG TPA: winged helix DNA-binding domain-containing protein [Mycobacteriales bacterium]|nr:winged helix DNA-binding domain-containing protein [Mycobacteriales bacterium]
MIRIGAQERRNRLAARHHLAPDARAPDVVTATRDLLALHATDPVTVYLSARARVTGHLVPELEKALYDDRVLIRMLGMRRTVFVVPAELAPVVQAACTRTIAARERRKTEQFLVEGGITDDPGPWLASVEAATLAALRARGTALSTELSADVPELAARIVVARGKAYEGSQSVASRLLPLLAADGLLVRGRPRGSWTSGGQYWWSPADDWLPGGFGALPMAEAQVTLARAWLAAFGPAPVADLKWWTGWTLGQARAAVAAVGAVAVDLDGVPGVALPDDLDPTPDPEPYVALLPGLDPTVMGWQDRRWFLGEHAAALFDTNGNAGPTLWWGGRVVGGWAQRKTGEVVLRFLSDVGAEARAAAAAEAERLREWMGDARVVPRFRTPLERELSG